MVCWVDGQRECVCLVVAVLWAAWCIPTSPSRRSSPSKRMKTPSWTSKARWLYDDGKDTGFKYFYRMRNLYLWSIFDRES